MKLKRKIAKLFGEDASFDYETVKKESVSQTFLRKSHFQELLPYRLYSEERGIYENDSTEKEMGVRQVAEGLCGALLGDVAATDSFGCGER